MAANTANPSLDSAQVRKLSQEILNTFTLYSLNKFGDSDSRLAAGTETFLSCIGRYVSANQRVLACLPAFPFKSANKVQKVLGTLPDKAEELALQRLNTICERIQDIYPPGAEITIISDGITYNGKQWRQLHRHRIQSNLPCQTSCPSQIRRRGTMAKHCV